MALTSKQIRFCDEYILSGNASEAYQKAYNNTNTGTCRVNSTMLLKKPEITKYLKSLQSVAKQIHKKKQKQVIESTEHLKVLPIAQRIDILTRIALGEIPLKKAIVVDKAIEYIEVVPDWADRKNAIAELNKMDGSYAPTKQAITDIQGNDAKVKVIGVQFVD
jgi:phage terminase small subunit